MPTPSDAQLDAYVAFAHRLADVGAEIALKHFRTHLDVENKQEHGFDPVTLADKSIESAMRALIEQSWPSHGVYGEEHGRFEGASGLTWVIDPIDGTRAFITGSPLWGILIALSDSTGPVLGMLEQPFLGERFWGTRSQRKAAFYRRAGQTAPLKARPCRELKMAALSTTTMEMFDTPDTARPMQALQKSVRLLRFGGDCYQYAQIALGFLDLVAETGLKPFDIHALIPIIEGAGGAVTTWSGESAVHGGSILAAGDPRVHAQALRELQKAR